MMKKIWVRALLYVAPVTLILAAVLLRDTAFYIAREILPPCTTYEVLGIFCPGCGLTRCILALIQGNLLLAIRQNAAIVALLLMLVLLYGEAVLLSFGKDVHFLPRRAWFWVLFGICAAVYFVLRNIIPELMPVPIIL